jgi:hypothetical protein
MADAVLEAIADAVKDVLNGASLSQVFTSTVEENPTVELKTLNTLTVMVAPISRKKERATRGTHRTSTYVVDVGVRQKIDVSDTTALRPLIYLMDEIADLFLDAKQLTGHTTATCISAEMIEGAEGGFAQEHLEKLRQFTGVCRLTFRVV